MVRIVLLHCIVSFGVSCGRVHAAPPDPLAAFRLDHFPALRDFARSRAAPHTFGETLEHPGPGIAALNVRAFHGPSELDYSVLLFPTQASLQAWDKIEGRMAQAWVSPLRQKPDTAGVRQSRLGGIAGTLSSAIVINRILIIVGEYQHREMIRRFPRTAGTELSDAVLNRRIWAVKAALIARAKALSANRN